MPEMYIPFLLSEETCSELPEDFAYEPSDDDDDDDDSDGSSTAASKAEKDDDEDGTDASFDPTDYGL